MICAQELDDDDSDNEDNCGLFELCCVKDVRNVGVGFEYL